MFVNRCLSDDLASRPRWLVVDDEPGLSEIIAETLTDLGLACVENFTSAVDALRHFIANGVKDDLVITDRDMPGLDGLEFARCLHAHAPGVKVILVSAHTDDVTATELRHAGICAVVQKPFRRADLETATLRVNALLKSNEASLNFPIFMTA